jgi:rubrerythrin
MGRKKIYENNAEKLRAYRARKKAKTEQHFKELEEQVRLQEQAEDPEIESLEDELEEDSKSVSIDDGWECPNCGLGCYYNWMNCPYCRTDMPQELEERAKEWVKNNPRQVLAVVRFGPDKKGYLEGNISI